jgi:phage gp36-like protein
MSYAAQADLTERFGEVELIQLTDRATPPAGEIDTDVVDRALADADAIIDSRIGGRYAVPLAAPLPADIVRVACDIARYLLHDLGAPETVRQHYEDAIAWLGRVADGRLPLIGSAGGIVSTRTTVHSAVAVRAYPAEATFGESFATAWAP